MRILRGHAPSSRGHGDEGITLPELLVSMMISGIVFALSATMIVTSVRQRRFAEARVSSQADARIAVELLSRDLRVAHRAPNGTSASAFEFASPRKIVFYSLAGGEAQQFWKVTYEVDATSNCLRRTTIAYTGTTFPAAAATGRCVAPAQVNTGGEAIFGFSRLQTSAATPPLTVTAPSAGLSLPSDDATLRLIASVQISLLVRAPDAPDIAPTTVRESITLINQSNALRTGRIT
ncbi:MAG: hypothetical protein JNL54_01225 [Kineosporiaceae bacterium]|nr:hypothetical protein [Kineosporiaceae bacterium]